MHIASSDIAGPARGLSCVRGCSLYKHHEVNCLPFSNEKAIVEDSDLRPIFGAMDNWSGMQLAAYAPHMAAVCTVM
jgi:hypothetical protein